MKKISKIILCFVSTLEKRLQSNQYQDLFFGIRNIRTKYVYFLFRLNCDFGFFIKPWRNRLCIWTVLQNQYQDLFFGIRHIRTKYVCFLFRLNCDFGFFIKPWRNRLCIWTVLQKVWTWIVISEAVCLLNSPLLERSDDLSNWYGLTQENLTLYQTTKF